MDEEYDLVDPRSGTFEGLTMTLTEARTRQAAAHEHARRLMITPVRYRGPAITFAAAQAIAAAELGGRRRRYQGLHIDEPALHSDHPVFYTFLSVVHEWSAEGVIPGGLMCSIDKVDGHVWTEAEFELLASLQVDS